MNTQAIQAAHTLRNQHLDLRWCDAIAWAWQCLRKARERQEAELAAKQAEWFLARKEALRSEQWREKVRGAGVIDHVKHAAMNDREGGWCVEYLPPSSKEAA